LRSCCGNRIRPRNVGSRDPLEGFERIAVVGTSGSGKTTLARRLAERLGCDHVELDSLYWGPGWTPVPRDLFRERVTEALDGETWTTDGNYGSVRDIVWWRADTVVWLDYSLAVVMGRVTWRTIRRSALREELWSGNRERIGTALLSRDSIILWAFNSYRRRKREYPVLFGQPEYAHLRVVHLASPGAADAWFESLPEMQEA
jgi:adenylate kinase family enzyme